MSPHHQARERARVVVRQAGSMPAGRDRPEIEPTHVDAVLEPYSDQGSIPCASIRPWRDVSPTSRFFMTAHTASLFMLTDCKNASYDILNHLTYQIILNRISGPQ